MAGIGIVVVHRCACMGTSLPPPPPQPYTGVAEAGIGRATCSGRTVRTSSCSKMKPMTSVLACVNYPCLRTSSIFSPVL